MKAAPKKKGETADDPQAALAYMNGRYAWIETLNRAAMETSTGGIKYLSSEGLTNAENRRKVTWTDSEGKPSTVPLGSWWIRHRERRTYESVGLYPPPSVAPIRAMNLWQGFAIEPKQGDWTLLRTFIRDIIAAGNETIDEYIIKWIAFLFQCPGCVAEAALVLRGERGVGKGTLYQALATILAPHVAQLSGPEQLTGRFNDHLERAVLVFADESFWAGDKKAHGTLNRNITEPTLWIDTKGVPAREATNRLHILIAGNSNWLVPAGADERRYVATDVSSARKQDFAYFAAIRREMQSGGLAAMLHDMLALDLGEWHPRQIVDSPALRAQKELSLEPVDEWLLALLEEGQLPRPTRPGPDLWTTSEALELHAQQVPKLRNCSARKLGPALRSIGATDKRPSPKEPRGWQFPTLAECRAAWDKTRWVHAWTDGDSWT